MGYEKDKAGGATSAAIYAGMVAYSREYKRIFRSNIRINGRRFLVAVDAYEKAFIEFIDDNNETEKGKP